MQFSLPGRSAIYKTWDRFRHYSDTAFWIVMIVLNLLIPLLCILSVMEQPSI